MGEEPLFEDFEDASGLELAPTPSTPVADAIAIERVKAAKAARARFTPKRRAKRNAYIGLPDTTAADRFLERQSRMLDIQMEHLHEQRGLQLTHLRLRRLNEYLKLGLQALTISVGLVVVGALVLMAVQARRDDAVVIEPFRTPPELTQRGLDGATLATQFLDDLRRLQEATDSARAPSTFRNNWGEDIKVEIPETGVSIGDIQRYMRQTLGHETHITGELVRGPPVRDKRGVEPGPLLLTVRVGPLAGQRLPGTDDDLEDLVQLAAEKVFSQTQPYRYVVYLARHDRIDEALTQVEQLAGAGSAQDRAWAYAYWGGLLLVKFGDVRAGEEKEFAALRQDPNLAIAWHNLAGDELLLGHDESALQKLLTLRRLLSSKGAGQLSKSARQSFLGWAQVRIDELRGDFRSAVIHDQELQADSAKYGTSAANVAAVASINSAGALALGHDLPGARRIAGSVPPANASSYRQVVEWGSNVLPILAQRVVLRDWKSMAHGFDASAAAAAEFPLGRTALPVLVDPWLAYARTMSGDRVGADRLIETTPRDCYLCVRMRGKIAAARKDWAGAERWFAEAVRQAPSLPFAYTDWGEMLTDKGDLDGAVRQFSRAHQKGPHYADALELWGEALMKQRSYAAAVEKFALANKDTPQWGRLHAMWGKALDELGQSSDAAQQYRLAATLELGPADRALLPRR